MKFLLDVNTSGVLFKLLLESGHDISCVTDVDSGMSDDLILDWAIREERIIVTTDSDFEQMIWLQERSHYGVLRLENLPRQERIRLFQEVLVNHAQDLELGLIVIATQKKIRVRGKQKNVVE
jgi:predicted nuclease of predicted toxin-antitoxin system